MANAFFPRILALLAITLIPAAAAHAQPSVTCSGVAGTNCLVQIPDGLQPAITSSMVVPAGALQCARGIAGVGVRVDVAHAWIGDLRVRVTAPNGQTATLLDALQRPPASSCDNDDIRASFFDVAPTATCSTGYPALAGTARPVTPLAPLAGTLAGTWQLSVQDLVNGNNGLLNNWGLELRCLPEEIPSQSNRGLLLLGMLLLLAGLAAVRGLRS
jgi:subtilisin-like proprotein convertase family protein